MQLGLVAIKMMLCLSWVPWTLLALIVAESTDSATSQKRPPTTCLDEHGQPIDWMISYKLPVIRKTRDKLLKSGWAYASISSKSVANSRKGAGQGWSMSSLPINDHDSMIMKIIEPIHDSLHIEGLSTVFYNDQPPDMNPPSPRLAHAKGVLALDETTNSGFWLTHSVSSICLTASLDCKT